jgi:hypothetical protein
MGTICPMHPNLALRPELRMEHRWGTRIAVHIPVRLTAAGLSMASIGRLTDLSLSGGFITIFGLRPLARIHLSLEYPLPWQRPVEKLPAFVARVCAEGAGIVWCEFAPRAVIELLRTMTNVTDPDHELIPATSRAGYAR